MPIKKGRLKQYFGQKHLLEPEQGLIFTFFRENLKEILPVILVKDFLPKRTPNRRQGKKIPKNPMPKCVIRRNETNSYRKG